MFDRVKLLYVQLDIQGVAKMKINKLNTVVVSGMAMKRIAFGLLLSTLLGTAHAGILSINTPVAKTFSGYNGQPETITGPESSGFWGSLVTDSAGTFSATYLGNESAFVDKFTLNIAGSLLEANALGTTISTLVGSGLVDFSFSDNSGGGHTFANGQAQTPVLGFMIMPGQNIEGFGAFDYILGFNDSATGDADYDDFVVGVKFVAAAVPEPETYAMMLAGIGMMGFMVRRRKNQA